MLRQVIQIPIRIFHVKYHSLALLRYGLDGFGRVGVPPTRERRFPTRHAVVQIHAQIDRTRGCIGSCIGVPEIVMRRVLLTHTVMDELQIFGDRFPIGKIGTFIR